MLYHKVVHEPSEEIADSIQRCGLIPQVASAYKDLVPLGIRGKPVVWLADRLHSYTDAPVFAVKEWHLEPSKLRHVTDIKLHWWVYQGAILVKDVSPIRSDMSILLTEEEIERLAN